MRQGDSLQQTQIAKKRQVGVALLLEGHAGTGSAAASFSFQRIVNQERSFQVQNSLRTDDPLQLVEVNVFWQRKNSLEEDICTNFASFAGAGDEVGHGGFAGDLEGSENEMNFDVNLLRFSDILQLDWHLPQFVASDIDVGFPWEDADWHRVVLLVEGHRRLGEVRLSRAEVGDIVSARASDGHSAAGLFGHSRNLGVFTGGSHTFLSV